MLKISFCALLRAVLIASHCPNNSGAVLIYNQVSVNGKPSLAESSVWSSWNSHAWSTFCMCFASWCPQDCPFTPQSHLCNDSFNGSSLNCAMCYWSGASSYCAVLHVQAKCIPWGWQLACSSKLQKMHWSKASDAMGIDLILMCKSGSDLVLALELTCVPLWIWLQGGEAGIGDSLDDYTLMRWLKAESNDVDKAESRLRKHAIWREENFPEGRVLEVSVLRPVCPFMIIHWTNPNMWLLTESGLYIVASWYLLLIHHDKFRECLHMLMALETLPIVKSLIPITLTVGNGGWQA